MTVHAVVTAFNQDNIEYGKTRIDGKRYNSDTAKLVAETGTLEKYDPLYFNVMRVYRKHNNEYFVIAHYGAGTEYSINDANGAPGPSFQYFTDLTRDEAYSIAGVDIPKIEVIGRTRYAITLRSNDYPGKDEGFSGKDLNEWDFEALRQDYDIDVFSDGMSIVWYDQDKGKPFLLLDDGRNFYNNPFVVGVYEFRYINDYEGDAY